MASGSGSSAQKRRTSSTYSNSRVWTKSLKASLSVQLPQNACRSYTPELMSAFTRNWNWSGFTCSSWHKISWMSFFVSCRLKYSLALDHLNKACIRCWYCLYTCALRSITVGTYVASPGGCSKYSTFHIFCPVYYFLWAYGPCCTLFLFRRILMCSCSNYNYSYVPV